MSKRFYDTGLIEKEWYMKLKHNERCAMHIIFSKCDNVGVWEPNFILADALLGEKLNWNGLLDKVNGNIKVLDNGKWWIVDFVDFQYGDIRKEEEVKDSARKSYIRLLKKHGLWDLYAGATEGLQRGRVRGLQAHKDKDKDKDLDKDKEKDKELMKQIEELFLTVDKINYNYKYDRKYIYILIDKVLQLYEKDPGLENISVYDFIKNMIYVYAKNKKAKKKIYQNPIVPHILASDKMFPQILEEMKNIKSEQITQEQKDILKELYG
jgi:hypothetical protein